MQPLKAKEAAKKSQAKRPVMRFTLTDSAVREKTLSLFSVVCCLFVGVVVYIYIYIFIMYVFI